MTSVKFGEVEDTNGDANAARVDTDLTATGPEMNRVVVELAKHSFPHQTSWMLPEQARQFANKILAAAELAESRNREAAVEAAEWENAR
jgi:hypothetical protein